jgi:hypothetical protein
MPITRLLSKTTHSSEEVREIVYAYEGVLASLHLTDRTDPITELIAQKILDCARTGAIERDRLRDCALAAFQTP